MLFICVLKDQQMFSLQWCCVMSRSPVQIQCVPWVCVVLASLCTGCAQIADVCWDSSSDQYLVFCLEHRNLDIVLIFFVLWLENIDGLLGGEQNVALGKLEKLSSVNLNYSIMQVA